MHAVVDVGSKRMVSGWSDGAKEPRGSNCGVGFLCGLGIEGDDVQGIDDLSFVLGDEPP